MAVHARGALPFGRDRSRAETDNALPAPLQQPGPDSERGVALLAWKRKPPDEPLARPATWPPTAGRGLKVGSAQRVLVSASSCSMSRPPGRGRDNRKLERDCGPESHRQAKERPRRRRRHVAGAHDRNGVHKSADDGAAPRCRGSAGRPANVKHPLGRWCPGRGVQSCCAA